MLRDLFRRCLGMFRLSSIDREFEDEVALHLVMLEKRFVDQGMSPKEASLAARKQFGGIAQAKEEHREMLTLPTVSASMRELRLAFRQLGRAKRFAAATSLTLGLGIGVSSAVFAVVDSLVFQPLPYAQPDRLMAFQAADAQGAPHPLSYPNFFDYRERNESFEHLVCYRSSDFTLSGSNPPVQVAGEIVSWDLFSALGVQPAIGRGFLPQEEMPGAHAAVLGHSLWISRFGGDPAVVGKSVQINGKAFTVVGVAPKGFQFPVDTLNVELWVTISEDAGYHPQRGARMLGAVGRLKPGVSIEQAQARMDLIAAALAEQFPDNERLSKSLVMPERERVAGSDKKALLFLLGAVGMLLMISCANVAGLVLARNAERGRDFALQTALGASKSAIVRQVLIEGLVLGLLGAVAGSLIAWGIIAAVTSLAAETVPRLFQVGVDGRILAFSIALAIATSAAFSFTPALRAAKTGPIGGLKEGALNVAGGNDRFRNALVMLQIGLGLILLVVAESFAAGYVNVVRRDPGFRPNGLVAFDIGHSERLSTVAGQISFSESFLERLRQIPGVQEAAMGRPMPLQGHELRLAFDIEGRPTSNTERPRADAAIVTSGFFQAMGIPLLSGRDFTEADRLDTPPVLVVNQAFARKFFPGEDVIGKHIRPGAGNPGEGPPVMREIVGVVGDAKQSLAGDYDPIYYFPFEQLTWGIGTMVLRTTVPPFQIESAAREILADLDPVAPIHRVRTGNQLADAVTAMMRFLVILTGGFAVVALLLAVTGLYGVLSYAVEKRRREIGIRIAVGADRNQVLALVFRQATVMLAVGLVFGLAGAAVSGRVLAAALSGVGTLDWTLLAIACCTMIGAGIAATYIPAVRAATVDPMQALRNE